jgi:hypothetical protein
MIALQQRERWAPEHAVRHEEIVFREVEYKAVRLFRTGAPHLWPTVCAQLDEIRNVPLILVKVTFLRNGQE